MVDRSHGLLERSPQNESFNTFCLSLYFCFASPRVFQRCHNYMTDQLGIPVWGSYVIFGLVTLFSGLALGLVCCTCSSPWCCWCCCHGSEAPTLTFLLFPAQFPWQNVSVCFFAVAAAAAGLHRRFCLPLSTVLSSGLPPKWVSMKTYFFLYWCFLTTTFFRWVCAKSISF